MIEKRREGQSGQELVVIFDFHTLRVKVNWLLDTPIPQKGSLNFSKTKYEIKTINSSKIPQRTYD